MVKHGRLTLHFYSKVTLGMHVIGIFSGKRILLPAFKRLLALCSALIGEKTSKTCATCECGGFDRLELDDHMVRSRAFVARPHQDGNLSHVITGHSGH